MSKKRIPLPRDEYDSLRERGYGERGPQRYSNASREMSAYGHVPKGSDYCDRQRKGMLGYPVDSDDDDGGGGDSGFGELLGKLGTAGLVVGALAGIGLAGYGAYRYFRGNANTPNRNTTENRNDSVANRPNNDNDDTDDNEKPSTDNTDSFTVDEKEMRDNDEKAGDSEEPSTDSTAASSVDENKMLDNDEKAGNSEEPSTDNTAAATVDENESRDNDENRNGQEPPVDVVSKVGHGPNCPQG